MLNEPMFLDFYQFFKTKTSFADRNPPDYHCMAQDELNSILVIKIAWQLGPKDAKWPVLGGHNPSYFLYGH